MSKTATPSSPDAKAARHLRITEPSPWYESSDYPWGRPILPIEMISVLSNKVGSDFVVRGPAIGLFVDLEIGLIDGPLFVDEEYVLEREVVALGQSRRVESYWVRTTIAAAATGSLVADVLLHSGTFKASYADYPADRLEWRPHDKSWTLGELASHVANLVNWTQATLVLDELDIARVDREAPTTPIHKSSAELVKAFDENAAAAREFRCTPPAPRSGVPAMPRIRSRPPPVCSNGAA